MSSYLIDTNVLIQVVRRKQRHWEVLRELVEQGGSLGCSVITIGELYAGMREHETARTEELLDQMDLYDVTPSIARQAGRLKNDWAAKGYQLALADMLIASTALIHNLTLLTENSKDFPMPGLRLVPSSTKGNL